jgi:hypothetical protein
MISNAPIDSIESSILRTIASCLLYFGTLLTDMVSLYQDDVLQIVYGLE